MQELSIVNAGSGLLVQPRGIDAPIAIRVATGKSEQEILNAVTEVSERPRRGLSPDEIKKALKKLGVKHRDVSNMATKDDDGETKLHKHITEKEFLTKASPNKTYILTNRNHTWVVKNKEIIDPVWVVPNVQSSRRRLVNVIEVIDPKVETN